MKSLPRRDACFSQFSTNWSNGRIFARRVKVRKRRMMMKMRTT